MAMGMGYIIFLSLLAMASCLWASTADIITLPPRSPPLSRRDFPKDFVFGSSSSAYQYEGAAFTDGKEASVWDIFTERYPEKIADGSNGLIAVDFYHRYKEDVKLMKDLGIDAFRFSISWPRVVPTGQVSRGVNQAGIQFYNNLINELLINGIKPYATLFHWDLPQGLQEEYCGFLSQRIVDDFKDYAELCFREFGDRVKNWMTFNEPNLETKFAHGDGTFAPGRCSNHSGTCTSGETAVEPYLVAHHKHLAHAEAVHIYRTKFQHYQQGLIGFTIASDWVLPLDHTYANKKAAERALDWSIGWIVDPIVFGDYPKSMRAIVGSRLPKFTRQQSELLKGSYDFIGLQHYSTMFAYDAGPSNSEYLSFFTDQRANFSFVNLNGDPIGEPTPVFWLYIYPDGIRDLVLYVKEKYNNPPIIITENGIAEANIPDLPLEEALDDSQRQRYYEGYLTSLHEGIEQGAKVVGYFTWTFLDDFEWGSGYTIRFGLHFVDYKDDLKRYPKKSTKWFKRFLKRNHEFWPELAQTAVSNDEL
ncbi:hypothetical protein Dimus_003981 [Dionaea muscipula]